MRPPSMSGSPRAMGFEREQLATELAGIGEINEGKLQLRNGLALEERAAFPEKADKGIDFVAVSGVAKRIERNALRALHQIVKNRGCHSHGHPRSLSACFVPRMSLLSMTLNGFRDSVPFVPSATTAAVVAKPAGKITPETGERPDHIGQDQYVVGGIEGFDDILMLDAVQVVRYTEVGRATFRRTASTRPNGCASVSTFSYGRPHCLT